MAAPVAAPWPPRMPPMIAPTPAPTLIIVASFPLVLGASTETPGGDRIAFVPARQSGVEVQRQFARPHFAGRRGLGDPSCRRSLRAAPPSSDARTCSSSVAFLGHVPDMAGLAARGRGRGSLQLRLGVVGRRRTSPANFAMAGSVAGWCDVTIAQRSATSLRSTRRGPLGCLHGDGRYSSRRRQRPFRRRRRP